MATGDDLVAQARRVLGRPYEYGADGPNTFDCSGLVKWCCDNIGITACPRTSEAQFGWTQRVDTPSAGDLVFFVGAEIDPPPGHVGIVVAPGQMIQAPFTGSVVQQSGYGTGGQGVNTFMGYGRLPGITSGNVSSDANVTQQQQAVSTAVSYGAVIFVILFLVAGIIVATLFVLKVLM